MADWNTIIKNEVLEEFSPAEQTSMTTALLTDELPSILARTVNMVRGRLKAAGNTLGDTDTIPNSLRDAVVAIARWRLLIALPKLAMMQTAERKAAYDDAMKLLDEISKQEIPIEPPADGSFPRGGTWGSETKIVMRTHTSA